MLWLGCSHPAETVRIPVEHPLPTRWQGERIRASFGINEPIPLPRKIALDLPPADRDARVDAAADRLRWLGVTRVRLHSANFPYLSQDGQRALDPTVADRFLGRILASGLDPLVMIGPWPGNDTMSYTSAYVPDDLPAYADWVRATVERYDGDGVGDALAGGIHAWEVDNEPDLHHAVPPRSRPDLDPAAFCRPSEYVRVFDATKAAILEADPSATVLPAGLARPFDPKSAGYRLDGASNVHAYPRGDLSPLWTGLDALGSRGPTWITEVSTSAEGSERDQAIDLAALFFEGLRRDIRTIYWHALTEPPDAPGSRPGITRGRHLFAPTGDAGRDARWQQARPRLAAWTLRGLLSRYGDVARGGLVEVAVDGAHALRIGADVVIWDERGRGSDVVVPWPADGPVTVTGLVSTGVDGETPRFPSRDAGPGTVDVPLAGGPVAISPR